MGRGTAAVTGDWLAPVTRLLDAQVASGHLPGAVLAVRRGGVTRVHTAGRRRLRDDAPMTEDTRFHLASVTKPIGAALAHALAEDGVVALDEPVDRWLPELASPRVLVDVAGPLERTEPARRPITVRDLLAMTSGLGCEMTGGPLPAAMDSRGVGPSAFAPDLEAGTWLACLAELPLAAHPGTAWLYHTSSDVLGVLLARAAGRTLPDLLAELVTGPLGMTATGFDLGGADTALLAGCCRAGPDGRLVPLAAPPADRPPRFASLAAGLVSTAPDLLRFFTAMADGGGPVLSPASVRLMTTDALDADVRATDAALLDPGTSWGLGVGVDVEAGGPDHPQQNPGRWGWTGGTGTAGYVDPARDLVVVLLTQRLMAGPHDTHDAFWKTLHAAITDRDETPS